MVLGVEDRRSLERFLDETGFSALAISRLVGVSQSVVSGDLDPTLRARRLARDRHRKTARTTADRGAGRLACAFCGYPLATHVAGTTCLPAERFLRRS